MVTAHRLLLANREVQSDTFVCPFRFGTIISTKAILDKNTNKCKGELFRAFPNHGGYVITTVSVCIGYGFVDFDSPAAAEGAVKALVAKNIQAQMAKVGIWFPRRQHTVRLHASNT